MMRRHGLHDQAFILNVADVGVGSKLYLLQREKLHLQKWRGGGGSSRYSSLYFRRFCIPYRDISNLFILNVADVGVASEVTEAVPAAPLKIRPQTAKHQSESHVGLRNNTGGACIHSSGSERITSAARVGLGHFKVLYSVLQVRKSKRYVVFIQHFAKLGKTVGVVTDCPRSLSNTSGR